MHLRADLHIHSKYARAASRDLDVEHMAISAWRKGIQILGTGDLTHPAWRHELQEKLIPAEDGLFRLKPDLEEALQRDLPPSLAGQPLRFVLSVEVSTIFERPTQESQYKVHQLVCVPGWEEADALQTGLAQVGNLRADGLPLLGMDARDLLELILDVSPRNVLIPTHIFDHHNALLGMRTGFPSIEACYGDLTPQIFAIETGVSATPSMLQRISALDGCTWLSHSDAHTPGRIGREASLFQCELGYDALFGAIKKGVVPGQKDTGFLGTIEYYAEESRYFLDGHRSCKVRLYPGDTIALEGICPVCKKPLTQGVLHRVEQLADRAAIETPLPPHTTLLPLERILAEIFELGTKARKVQRHAQALLASFGPEIDLLQTQPLEDLKRAGIPLLSEAIHRMREGQVEVEPGYDGEYGSIRLFQEDESKAASLALFPSASPKEKDAQLTLFSLPKRKTPPRPAPTVEPVTQLSLFQPSRQESTTTTPPTTGTPTPPPMQNATEEIVVEMPLPRVVMARRIAPVVPSTAPPPQPTTLPRIRLMSPRAPKQAAAGASEAKRLLFMLNTEQRTAVLHQGAPMLLSAGPGTGKTRTLAHRVAYLITKRQVQASQCLTLTLTPQAAQSLSLQIMALLPNHDESIDVPVYTFAQLCLLLQHEDLGEHAMGQDAQDVLPQVLTSQERAALLRAVAQERGIKMTPAEESLLLHHISWCKQRLLLPDDCAQIRLGSHSSASDADRVQLTRTHDAFLTLYQEYQNALRSEHLTDADDLVVETVLRLQRDPSYRQKLQQRYRSIHVDEGQDLNKIQWLLLRHMTLEGTDLCVAGDPDQAIFQSLGADVRYFQSFLDDFSTSTRKAIRCGLWRNYRSPERCLDAAHALISTQDDPRRIMLLATAGNVANIPLLRFATPFDEATYIAQTIQALLAGAEPFGSDMDQGWDTAQAPPKPQDIVVFIQEPSRSHVYRDALQAAGIPFNTDPFPTLQDTAPGTPEAAGQVGLLPLHAAKGREWPIVFIAACITPSAPAHWPMAEEAQRDDSTRLLYVGITRAKERLILSYADTTEDNGMHQPLEPLACLEVMTPHLVLEDRTK